MAFQRSTTKTMEPASVKNAQDALAAYWGTRGDQGMAEAADECRKLTAAQLRLIEAWIPHGSGLTEQKCDRARRIVAAVIAEKG